MKLLELIKQRTIEEAERIGFEQGFKIGFELMIKKTVKKMLAKGFSKEQIADILEIDEIEVTKIEQGVVLKNYFLDGWILEKVIENAGDKMEELLLSKEELTTLYQEVAVEQLLRQGIANEVIKAQLNLDEAFIKAVEKTM
jgi:DNA-binding NarL/FixJ family response regulator